MGQDWVFGGTDLGWKLGPTIYSLCPPWTSYVAFLKPQCLHPWSPDNSVYSQSYNRDLIKLRMEAFSTVSGIQRNKGKLLVAEVWFNLKLMCFLTLKLPLCLCLSHSHVPCSWICSWNHLLKYCWACPPPPTPTYTFRSLPCLVSAIGEKSKYLSLALSVLHNLLPTRPKLHLQIYLSICLAPL